jgi:hypothetical protein
VTVAVRAVPDALVQVTETRLPASWVGKAAGRSAELPIALPPTLVTVEPAVIPAFRAADSRGGGEPGRAEEEGESAQLHGAHLRVLWVVVSGPTTRPEVVPRCAAPLGFL